MKEQYGGTMIQALKTVLPIKQKENAKVKKHLRLLLTEARESGEAGFLSEEESESKSKAFGSFEGSPNSGL